jgi:Zn-dependent protease with chaperone function
MNSVPNPSLDTGLAALKQGNYALAIAHLNAVRETELDEAMVTRASQGLVIAYRKSGEIENAIAVCQHLTHHSHPKVREWATSNLSELQANSSASASDSTGFVPLDGTSNGSSNGTGFAPLNSNSSPASTLKQRLVDSTQRLFSTSKTPAAGQASIPKPSVSATAESSATESVLPQTYSPPSTPTPSLFTPRPRWRNSGRAQKWNPLKPLKLRRLWWVELVTAIALFVVLHVFSRFVMQTTNSLLVGLPFLNPIQPFYRDPTPAIAIILVLLLVLSPWLIDGVLKLFYGLEPLSLSQLTTRTPEAAKVIQQFCRQRKIAIPTLGILPTQAPVALTYGNLPRTARIVISEGLLEQLAEDEVATIYAGQLGHIVHWDFLWMSVGVLTLQIPYLIYWHLAQAGEQFANFVERTLPSYRRFLPAVVQVIMGGMAALFYTSYWLFRIPLLWFSRARVYYSDRVAVETTGNPNGLTRALLKTAIGITEEIQHDHKTSGLLESFDLLLPVGYRQALTVGSCSPQIPFESVLRWDCINPYRGWLLWSASHPLLGERVSVLSRNAQFWKLDSELSLPAIAPPVRNNGARLSKFSNSPNALPLLQSAVLWGIVLGIIFRAVLWVIGQVGDWLNIWQVIWMHKTSSVNLGRLIMANKTDPIQVVQLIWFYYLSNPLLGACILIAFSLCLFLWINRYFPDIQPGTAQTDPNLGELLSDPENLPPDSQPIQLTGKLLGRQGLLNGLGQDLILQTSTGLVRLHFASYLGLLSNLLPGTSRPSPWVDQQVTITGWFRRGATPWIDIDTLRTPGGKTIRAHYPVWLTLVALVAAIWGAYLIWLT